MYTQTAKGITLIELLVTLTILAFLCTIGFPKYQHYILTVQRNTAKTTLSALSLAQAKELAINNTYAKLASLAVDTNSRHYQYSQVQTGNYQYTLKATAIGSQIEDINCRELTLNQTLVRTPINCW